MKAPFDDIRKIAARTLDAAAAAPGMDEEGGWACAWLEAAGLDGLSGLAEAIEVTPKDRRAVGLTGVDLNSSKIDCAGHSACFIGAVLVDFAVARGTSCQFVNLRQPHYLLPFADRCGWGATFDQNMRTGSVIKGASLERLHGAMRASLMQGITVSEPAYARIYKLSRAILVPESDQSRMTGAGAGLTDND